MTQREYLSGTLKIIGLIILVGGLIMAFSNATQAIFYYSAAKSNASTAANTIPDELHERLNDPTEFRNNISMMQAAGHAGMVLRWLIATAFGLALIKRDDIFCNFLLGRKEVQHVPPEGRGEAPRP